ncbi:MAG: hypothetical protein KDE08_11925 [Rhodobacteraceae bacterium]|nr:hypothetical protein [Paracoccaceae bacterium]
MSALPPVNAPVAIDADAIRTYCAVVFGYLDGLVPVRYLSEKGTPEQQATGEFAPVSKLADRLIASAPRAASDGRAVFVVPGTVAQSRSAKARDILQMGVVLVDLDHGDIAAKRNHLVHHLGLPTLEVASGGVTDDGQDKLHLYWRLTEAAVDDLQAVCQLRAAIAAAAGGDPSFGSAHQPIRVAGTIHGKNGRQVVARLIRHCDLEYELADLVERAVTMSASAGGPASGSAALRIDTGARSPKGPSAEELAMRVIREGGVDEVTRFKALSRVIGHWVRQVRLERCTLAEAWRAVADHNAAMIVPPWEDKRLRREFDGLVRVDCEQKGPMPEPGPEPGAIPAIASDDRLAAMLVATHGAKWRHVAAWGQWLGWTGNRWSRDETNSVREVARQVCRAAAAAAEKPAESRRIASDKTMTAVLRIAASDPAIATRIADWDAHPMLLNTPGGIVDLATGEIVPSDPTRHLTQLTDASPGASCPRWEAFLRDVTDDDAELQAYLARLAGYCLTGATSEQVFVFLHGSGGNGKSVFLQTIATVLGGYASTATLDTFMDTRASRHLTELAGLVAARLVIVPETESGRSWAEARIKTVTGGEMIRANFMHRDHFEFRPQFKLIVAGNHRPNLSNVGEAMRRRLHLVPFMVTIPAERRDKDLAERLLDERDGILRWMLQGCSEWQRIGLAPPVSVRAAVEEYLASEDLIGQWIAECCLRDPQAKARSADLFQSWQAWAAARGFPWGTQKSLGEALRSAGFRDGKVGGARGWLGIAITQTAMARGDNA